MNWYVVQTKPMSEDRVCKQFANADVVAFCPKIKSVARGVKGAEITKFKPLFPNYIFLNWDLSSSSNHHTVKYTRGVNRVLGDSEKAVPISEDVISLIRSRMNDSGIVEQKTFKVGDEVKVKRGYLKDLMGILERPVSDSGRVAVLLQLFNRQMRVHLSCADIARA